MSVLGTKADIELNLGSNYAEQVANLEAAGYVERNKREDVGEGNRWSERQKRREPKINDLLVGYKFEMLLSYTEPDSAKFMEWLHP